MPNWAEQVTAIATAVSSLALLERDWRRDLRRETSTGDSHRAPGRDGSRVLQTLERELAGGDASPRRAVRDKRGTAGRHGPIHRGELTKRLCAVPRTRLFRATGRPGEARRFRLRAHQVATGTTPHRPMGDVATDDRSHRRQERLPDVRSSGRKGTSCRVMRSFSPGPLPESGFWLSSPSGSEAHCEARALGDHPAHEGVRRRR